MYINTIIFDLDYTLIKLGRYVDWLEGRKKMVKVYLKYGVSPQILVQYTSPSLMFARMYTELVKMFPKEKVIKIQKEASNALSEHELKALRYVSLAPNCLRVLQELRKKGVKIGIVSLNGEQVVREVLKRTGINKYVNVWFSRDSPGRPKPYPDHIIRCLERLHSKPQNSIMVGDEIADINAAIEAQVLPIGIATGLYTEEELKASGAKEVISTLSELLSVIERLENKA